MRAKFLKKCLKFITARGVYEMSVSYYNKFNEFMGTFSYEPLVTL